MTLPVTVVSFSDMDDVATDLGSLQFIGQLAEYLNPAIVAEAGTYRGHFGRVLTVACPTAKLWTADPCYYGAKLDPAYIFHHGDFVEMLEQYNLEDIDLAFIDSGPPCLHSFEADVRLRHWRAVKPRMRQGGLMICHDMNTGDWEGWDEIAGECLLLRGGRGIGLWAAP